MVKLLFKTSYVRIPIHFQRREENFCEKLFGYRIVDYNCCYAEKVVYLLLS